MNWTRRWIAGSMAFCCSTALILPTWASQTQQDAEPSTAAVEATYFGSADYNMRGLFVDSFDNRDYPNAPGCTAAVLGGQADEIVTFAKNNRFNTIFYEVSPQADAMYRSSQLPSSRYLVSAEGEMILSDPLTFLTQTIEMENIHFCASLSMLYAGEVGASYAEDSPVVEHPDWFITRGSSLYFNPALPEVRSFWVSVLKELIEKYSMDGLLLHDLSALGDAADIPSIALLVEECIAAVQQNHPEISVGISLDHTAVRQEEWQETLNTLADSVRFIMPEMAVSLSDDYNYSDVLEDWCQLLEGHSTSLYTYNMASLLNHPLIAPVVYGSERELSYQLYSNLIEGADGFVLHSYGDISGLRSSVLDELLLLPDLPSSALKTLNTSSQQPLCVYGQDSIVATEYDRFFLSGHCDPSLPLLINGKELDPSLITSDGYWGILLDVKKGSNPIHVQQGDVTERTLILSQADDGNNGLYLSDIDADSVYPQEHEILFEGEPLLLSCKAPYGGSVMAFFGDKTYHLNPPEGYTEDDIGKAVTYTLEIYPENPDPTQVSNLGTISYLLTYKDFTSKYRSEGQIYLVGSSSHLAVRVDGAGRVYQNTDKTELISYLLEGASDYAAQTANPNFYRLYSGGYIEKKDVSIVEGFVDIQKSVETVGIQVHEQGENLIFIGAEGLPYYCSYNDKSQMLTLQLSNVVSMPSSLAHLASSMFERIHVQMNEKNNVCTLRLKLKEGKELWGYQVDYQDENLYLRCKTAPLLGNTTSAPLAGLMVVIDAAHGGVDQGALGVLGEEGFSEADVTLAYAHALRHRLESLGAEVALTRSDDSTMDETDRVLYSSYKDADLYLSFQMNSSERQYNGWKESGLSVFYDKELSEDLGQLLYDGLCTQLRVQPNILSDTDLSVKKIPLAKAVVISLGSITNPMEYSVLTDPVKIYQSACQISDLLLQYLK